MNPSSLALIHPPQGFRGEVHGRFLVLVSELEMSPAMRQSKCDFPAMKRFSTWFWSLLAWAFTAVAPAQPQPANPFPVVTYTLLDGSYFVDDCLICGRPTIMQPLQGTFDLVLVQNTPPYLKYAVRNVEFTASPGWAGETRLTGDGTYVRFEEFALVQDMNLALQVKDDFTNRPAFFTNDTVVVQKPFPLIQIDLTQTNGTLLQTFSLNLFAAPLREVWFSSTKALTSTNRSGSTNVISPGDLISNRGRIVKRNFELTARLGVMPYVPDLGLDAVQVTRRGEILFAITSDVWSETLGQIHHGDLLSNRGVIVKRNQELLAAFGLPAAQPDAGLDALQIMPDGEILFSIRSHVVVNPTLTLGRGDILSDRGKVFRTNQELLANFHPAVTNHDYGLDALQILPGGEIWFSVEEGFTDGWQGTVQAGDLLSSFGHRVFNNAQLVAAFAPVDPAQDYGLDALFVVTDTRPPALPPRIVKLRRLAGAIGIDWDGDGDVFQLEHAPGISGPWSPCSPIVPDLTFDIACDLTTGGSGFYRLRQW
jgi:hypothetical protein